MIAELDQARVVRETLDHIRRLYRLSTRTLGVNHLLSPAQPLLTSVHASLLAMVEAALNDPSVVLQRSGNRWSPLGLFYEERQFALDSEIPNALVFVNAGYQFPFWKERPTLFSVDLVSARNTELDKARGCRLERTFQVGFSWSDYSGYGMKSEPVDLQSSGVRVRFGQSDTINQIGFSTSQRERLVDALGFNFEGKSGWANYPWSADLNLEGSDVRLEVRKGTELFSFKTDESGKLVDSKAGKPVPFKPEVFIRGAFYELPVSLG